VTQADLPFAIRALRKGISWRFMPREKAPTPNYSTSHEEKAPVENGARRKTRLGKIIRCIH